MKIKKIFETTNQKIAQPKLPKLSKKQMAPKLPPSAPSPLQHLQASSLEAVSPGVPTKGRPTGSQGNGQ